MLGVVAGYIAWRQWRTAHDRLLVDLFDRRFAAFQELTRAIDEAFHKPNAGVADLAKFDIASEKARFVFNREVHNYLSEIRKGLINIITKGRALSEMPDGPGRDRAEKEVADALNQMHQFYGRLADLVTPYLRITTRDR